MDPNRLRAYNCLDMPKVGKSQLPEPLILVGVFDSLFGAGKTTKVEPVLGGEDFACYLKKVPGAMLWLGVMNKRIKADKPWHSPQFIADEAAIRYGTALLAGASLRFLRDGLS